MTSERQSEWLQILRKFVERRPLAIVRLTDDQYAALLATRKGMTEFTLNIPHAFLREIVAPCMCIITGTRVTSVRDGIEEEIAYVSVIKSKSVRATLDTQIKIERTARVLPAASSLGPLIEDARFSAMLADRLGQNEPVTRLSPRLSVAVIGALHQNERNHGSLRVVAAALGRSSAGQVAKEQTDAIDMALRAFGLSRDAPAASVEFVKGRHTQLVGSRILEDAAIEHDARRVPEFELVGSDATGRATFRRRGETLEVITANRNKLEEAFGVDLIYVNHFHNNLVMVQYKMLNPNGNDDAGDWVYAQDRHLEKQLRAMNRFSPRDERRGTYRLSHEFFYFKFVRRFSPSPSSSMLIPLGHFEELAQDPRHQARSGALRLSYASLDGRYMRQNAFFSLLQSGYIGADTVTTNALRTLIDNLLEGGDALVVAIQRETTREEEESDRERSIGLWDDQDAGMH